VAPTVRSFSAEFEPLGLVARHPASYPGFLESGVSAAGATAGGRYDLLPISTGECLSLSAGGVLRGPHAGAGGGFLDALDRWWRALKTTPQRSDLPFHGGWLVYLGYEIAGEIESRLSLPPSADPLVALAIRTPAAWIRDRGAHRAWLVAEAGYEALCDRFEADAREAGPDGAPPPSTARFLIAVRRALAHIAAGDVYQANLSRQWDVESSQPLDPVEIYERLRRANPSPFAALLRHGDFALISSSPERLFSIRADRVSTRPIAGTRPRGGSPAADNALIHSLLDNEKERAEHVMLIDLERNDLGRVCVGGSVRVDEYMTVETYAHVHHIVSNVEGRLRPGVTPVQVIRAMFPGGTITGCPKVRCMQIIAELEGTGRGAYTGSLGYLNRDGSCDFNILIRTLSAHGQALHFRAGAGIVADSDPDQELAETRAKAEGLLRALGAGP
jgi:anthranilate synthase component 1